MKKALLVVSLILLIVVASTTTPHTSYAQGNDPASVYTAFVTALNAHTPDSALALFANTGVVISGPEIYNGKSEIMTWLQGQSAQMVHDDAGTPQVNGDSLYVDDEITTTYTTTLAVAPLRYDIQVVVTNGKITAYVAHVTLASGKALAAAVAKVTPAVDGVSLITALQKALNAGDATTAAGLFAPDGVIIVAPTATASGIYSGTAAIQTYYQAQIAQHIKILGSTHLLIAPGTVLSLSQVSNDTWTTAGITSLDLYSYTIVRNGKIQQQSTTLTSGAAQKLAAASTAATQTP